MQEIRRKEEEKKQSAESIEDPNSLFSGLDSFPTTKILSLSLFLDVPGFHVHERRYILTNFIICEINFEEFYL